MDYKSLYVPCVLWLRGSGKQLFHVSSSVTLVVFEFQSHHSLITLQQVRNRAMNRKAEKGGERYEFIMTALKMHDHAHDCVHAVE